MSGDAVDVVVEGKPRPVGSITVARVLPSLQRRAVGPFVFLDHMGPITLAPGVGFDVRPHPHIGLSTVTYFFEGDNVHRDSLGTIAINRPGDVNLMTAGRGIVHSERATPETHANGGVMHGVQIWLALPDANEEDAPSFEHHPAATLPTIAPAAGVTGRVLIGAAFGARSPIRHPSEPLLVDLEVAAGATIELPDAAERAVFVISGEVQVRDRVITADHLAVMTHGAHATLRATTAARVLLLGGPSPGVRVLDWNFVARSRERLAAARDAWKAHDTAAFPEIPTDHDERIPYPELHHP
jgi:hypothetical protein